jgi:hypothetical protein
MQFYDQDSTKAEEQLTLVYNSRGQIISESYGPRYYEHCLSIQVNYTVRYIYTDTLLTEKIVTGKQKNPERTVYAYNEQGRVKTESKFEWVPDPGAVQPHRPGMGGVPEKNRDTTRTVAGKWNQVSLAKITYDDKGRKITWDATRLHDENENMQKWEYDDQNRIASHSIYGHGKLKSKTDYTYTATGYRYWTVYYGQDGELKHENETGQDYRPMETHVVTLDKNGRIYNDKQVNGKGVQQCSTYYYYDNAGRIARTIFYDDGSTTHIYNYRK